MQVNVVRGQSNLGLQLVELNRCVLLFDYCINCLVAVVIGN